MLDHEVSGSKGTHIFKAFISENQVSEEVLFFYHGAILVF